MATRKRKEGKRRGRRERGERIMNKLDTQQARLSPENSVLLKEPQGHQIIFLTPALRLIRNYMLDMLTLLHRMSKGCRRRPHRSVSKVSRHSEFHNISASLTHNSLLVLVSKPSCDRKYLHNGSKIASSALLAMLDWNLCRFNGAMHFLSVNI